MTFNKTSMTRTEIGTSLGIADQYPILMDRLADRMGLFTLYQGYRLNVDLTKKIAISASVNYMVLLFHW